MPKQLQKKSVHPKQFWMWAVILFFGVVSLGQFGRIEIINWPAFYAHDVVLGIFVTWMLLRGEFRQFLLKILEVFPTLGSVSFGWAGTGLAIAAITGSSIFYPLATLSRILLYVFAAGSVLFLIKKNKLTVTILRSGLLFFFSLLLFFGIIQYALIPDTRFLFFLGWDDHYYRLISTMFDPGFTGILLVLGYFFLQEGIDQEFRFKSLQIGLSLGMIVGLLLTYSRASYLAFGVLMVFIVWKKWKQSQPQHAYMQACVLAMFVICLFFLPQPGGEGVKLGRTSTIEARAITAQQSFTNFNTLTSFVVGKGLFIAPVQTESIYSGTTSHAKVADNWMIALLSGTGVVGLFLSFAVLFKTLRWALSKPRSYLGIAILAVLVHGMFNAGVTYPFIWIALLSWGVITLES